MKTKTVEAYIGKGSDKVFAGTIDVKEPETFQECLTVFGSVTKTIDLAMRSYVIEEQNKLRNKPKKPKTANERLFAGMSVEVQNELLARAQALRDEGAGDVELDDNEEANT